MVCITIIGSSGAVGAAIRNAAAAMAGPKVVCLPKSQPVNSHDQGPIWVCTTNDALLTCLQADRLPPHRRKDVILLQNGHLPDLVASQGLVLPGYCYDRGLTPITQTLLYAAALPGGKLKCGGRTTVSGPLAAHCVDLLGAASVHCREVSGQHLAAAAVEKLIWASIAWLMCTALGSITVGQVVTQHRQEFNALALELLRLAARDPRLPSQPLGSTTSQEIHLSPRQLLAQEDRVLEGLISYSLDIAGAVPSRAMALAEFQWRNAYFLRRLAAEQKNGTGTVTEPTLHEEWLLKAGLGDLIAKHKECA